jgi:hypothetical protein
MKKRTKILILFLMLLVIPISTIFACENLSEKTETEKTSCSKEDNHSEKKSCCENNEKDDDNSCSRDCENKSCHCLTTINFPASFNDFELPKSNNFKLSLNEWTFIQYIPKAVYLSIWQPPKIS